MTRRQAATRAFAAAVRAVALAALIGALGGCAWISRASESEAGAPADADTPAFSPPAISADGRYVTFATWAGNLAPEAEDGGVLLRDTRGDTTTAVSRRVDGTVDDFADSPAISGDGRFVAFRSDDTDIVAGGNGNFDQVFVRDLSTGATSRVSTKVNGNQGTDDSGHPSLSHDGRYVAFESDSPGLVVADTNDATDVFVRDRVTNTTRRASVASAGEEAELGGDHPSISGDGRLVAFSSADALVAADQDHAPDIYVRDLVAGTTTLVSITTSGIDANSWSDSPAISANGRFVAFTSLATNIDAIVDTNDATDVFVRDLVAGTTQRVSVSSTGGLAHGAAVAPTLSGDGRFVSFESDAPDAVADDTNGVVDAFVFDREQGKLSRVSTDQLGAELPSGGRVPVLSADGRSVTFASTAQLMGLTPSAARQLYVRVTVPGVTPR